MLTTSGERLAEKVARRFFLDRQAEFWLGELRRTWSLSEIRAQVVDVVVQTRDTKTFVLRPNARWRGHRAGQHTTVELEIDGVRVRRCYSISSAPGERLLSITVKRVPQGRVSCWMHEHLNRGDVIRLGPAAGDFVLSEPAPAKLLLLSGGSGITPVMSILRDLAARGAAHDVVFVHHAHRRDDVIFRSELGALAARHRGLRVFLCSSDDPAGRFDEALLARRVPDFAERQTLLCGPPGFMARVERMWERASATARLQRERFVAPPRRTADERRVRVCAGSASLLELLERAGERPPYGCRVGICHTCTARKHSGTVQNLVTGVVSNQPDEDIQLCICVPRSDVELGL
jgi:ferredoxin-NADP reductase